MAGALAFKAFVVGILSASSLLMGAVASFYWRPSDRVVAFMMALGGGALLAALTIDLAGEAVHRGHYFSLCFGCLVGGLLFIGLDRVVGDYGGFMRKAATTVYHVRKQEHRRYKQILSGIGRTDIFRHLQTRHFKQLSGSIRSRDFKKGEIIFQPGDPGDDLHIVLSGAVELFYPEQDRRPSRNVGVNEAFGRMAFHTGAPHVTGAKVLGDTTVLLVPRTAFDALLLNSTTLQQVMHRWLRNPELLGYLCTEHHLDEAAARQWIDGAVHSLMNRGQIPAALAPKRNQQGFITIAEQIGRIPIFRGLPADELAAIGAALLHKNVEQGQALYNKGEPADRMYIVDQGELAIVGAQNAGSSMRYLRPNDAVGCFSWISGASHTVSVVTTTASHVWELRRADLADLLRNTQIFRERVKHFLQQDEFGSYLRDTLHFNRDKVERYLAGCRKAIDEGRPLPDAGSMVRNVDVHGGAAVAIWLGILLDGIPESLVIGSSMIQSHVSISLLFGLFIANFPESLSSSLGMKEQGFAPFRILLMWGSIVLITGIGAAFGNVFFAGAQPVLFTLVEGIAAGAMLTMIAQTMLPEAYFKGGSIVGFATLLGFLLAIVSKTLE